MGQAMWVGAAAILLATIAVSTGCQRGAERATDDAGSAEAAPAQGSAAGLDPGREFREPPRDPGAERRNLAEVDAHIVNVVFSNQGDAESGSIGVASERFESLDTVYLAVETDGTADSYTLYAKWMDHEGEVLSEYGTTVDGIGRQRRVLSLSQPAGWAAGRHSVELAINGGDRRIVHFEVSR